MPRPIELKVGGPRTRVELEEAEAIKARWLQAVAEPDVVVVKVDVSCRQWSVEAIAVIHPVLEQVAPTVVTLDLADTIAGLETSLGLAVMETWAQCFEKAREIKEIDLSDNAMGPRALERVASLLGAPKLVKLRFRNCGLSAETIPQLNEALMYEGKGASRLHELVLDKNMIGVEGARQVGELLPTCANLITFSYRGCRPESGGTKYLATGLKAMVENNDNHKLKKLMVEDCTFGSGEEDDDAIHALCSALEKLSDIKHLNMRDGGDLGETGTGLLAQALINSECKPVYLDFSKKNSISFTTFSICCIISDPTERALSLTLLLLPPPQGGCCIGPDGAEALNELLTKVKDSLKVLKLETDELETDGLGKIISAFDGSTNGLTHLHIDENELEEGAIDALLKSNLPNLRLLSMKENMDLEDVDDDKKQELRDKFPNARVFIEDSDEGDDGEQADDAVDELAQQMATLET
jgi:Ran GTPase-activating protein (RanGAP) involved in mRNA processing and transport